MNDPSQTYYDLLGVPPTASLDDIKKAFRRLARQHHPDVNPGDRNALELFQRINHIYQVLSDPVERDRYDRTVGLPSSHHSATTFNRAESIHTAAKWYQEGLQHSRKGRYQEAITAYTQALALNPNLVSVYNQRGFAHYKLGQLTQAFADYGEAINQEPHQSMSYYYRGLVRFKLGYAQSAIADYTRAIAIDSEHGQAYYHRGLAHADLNQKQQARNDLQTAHHCLLAQGNISLAQEAQSTYRKLEQATIPQMFLRAAGLVPGDVFMVLGQVTVHPVNGVIAAFDRLSPRRAMVVGAVLALWFSSCFSYYFWSDLQQYLQNNVTNSLSLGISMLLGLIPFGLLILVSVLGRKLNNLQGTLSGDLFIAGVALFPLSLLLCFSSSSSTTLVIISLVCGWYGCITLYKGWRYISGLGQGVVISWVAMVLTGLLLFFTLIP